jgi:hypothetical protein
MNPVCEDIKDMLEDSSIGAGTFKATTGWSIHLTEMPDDGNTPDTCIAVLDTGGPRPDPDPDKNIGNPTFQILVRGARMGYQDAWDKAYEILQSLHGKHGEDWNSTRYIQIFATSDILRLGYDESRRPLLSINFSVMRTE